MGDGEKAYRSAVRSLTLREHSRKELREKLQRKFPDLADADAVLDRLEREGLQSDRRFAEAYVRAKGRRLGAMRILADLDAKGVARYLAEECAGELRNDERALEVALECLRKKFPPGSRHARDGPRRCRFLAGRGFSAGVVRRAVEAHGNETAAG